MRALMGTRRRNVGLAFRGKQIVPVENLEFLIEVARRLQDEFTHFGM